MRAALAFLTVLGSARPPDRHTLAWFPAVGALLGATLAGVHHLGAELWSPLLVGAVVTTADLALTGMLHADGLADSADGLLPPAIAADRRLAIMTTPDIGAFGASALVTVLILRTAALATITTSVTLVGIWAASRAAIALVPAIGTYARPGGLATLFIDTPSRLVAVWIIPSLALLVATDGAVGAAALVALLVAVGAVVALAERRVGGFTGDVLGAALMIGETAGLLALAAS